MKIAQTEKYMIRAKDGKSKLNETKFNPVTFITKARFVILQYFDHSGNKKFLYKTFEYSVKETVSHLGVNEGLKLILTYVNEILLRKKSEKSYSPSKKSLNEKEKQEMDLVPVKEVEEQVQLIVKVIK